MRFAYYMLFFIYFLNASTGVFGWLLSRLGSDIVVVIAELMTGLSMYGTWVTANFSLDHLLYHDYQWMMIAALPILMYCSVSKGKKSKKKQRNHWILLAYPAAAYVMWFLGNYIL